MAFRPVGMTLAGGGQDGTITLWDAQGASRSRPARRTGHSIADIAFSPDGKVLASAAGSLKHVEERKLVASAEGHARSVDFSSDGALHLFDDGTWAAVDPREHYDGSLDGDVPHLHWALGDRAYPLERFKEKHHRPGLLARLFRE